MDTTSRPTTSRPTTPDSSVEPSSPRSFVSASSVNVDYPEEELPTSCIDDISSEFEQAALVVFNSLDPDASGWIEAIDVVLYLENLGFFSDDPRFSNIFMNLHARSKDQLGFRDFLELMAEEHVLLERAFRGELSVQDFDEFRRIVTEVYREVEHIKDGKVATYIAQLATVSPSHFAISFCSTDGQRFSIGESDLDFCVQSCCKPINYCIALEENGVDVVHKHIGREPSGGAFNKLTLNSQNLPHNPLINSGAIMTCSLIQRGYPLHARFENTMKIWSGLCGDKKVTFNNSVYLSEKHTADRNFCLGYMMREAGAFPKGADLHDVLEFYFQCCSIESNTDQMATVAATLANGGVCPLTGKRIFQPSTVKNCLSLMYTCGMYDNSGDWAFMVGIPAKSGVSGAIYAVTEIGGFCVFSPALDEVGNSARGVAFFKKLIERVDFKRFDFTHGRLQKEFWPTPGSPPSVTVDYLGTPKHAQTWPQSANPTVEEYTPVPSLSLEMTRSISSQSFSTRNIQRPSSRDTLQSKRSESHIKKRFRRDAYRDIHPGYIEHEGHVQQIIDYVVQFSEEVLRLDHVFQPSLKTHQIERILVACLDSNLRHLSLNGNPVLGKALSRFAEELRNNTSLRILQLDAIMPVSMNHSRFNPRPFQMLLKACFAHPSLEVLSLSNNHICNVREWLGEVVRGLENPRTRIRHLYLNDFVGIRSREFVVLLNAIKNNSTLEEVKLVIPCEHQINLPFSPYAQKGIFSPEVSRLVRSIAGTHSLLNIIRLNRSAFADIESFKNLGSHCIIEFDDF